jgi:hypothetical protein
MRQITKPEIVGSRITDIHAIVEDFHGCDCTTIYFTVDRGFSFTLPEPGYEWKTVEVPPTAERVPPSLRYIADPPSFGDVIERLKQRRILGVFCRKIYEPDASLLLFDDGSQVDCVTVAPHGTGATGLNYRTNVDELLKISELVDFFEVPLESEQ